MSIVSSGTHSAELSHRSATYIAAHEQILPLRDQIIVEPLPIEHSSILEVVEDIKPVRGIVRAVGPGHYPLRYDHADKKRRTKMWQSTHFQPTETKVGDIVELGSIKMDDGRYTGYSFQKIFWGGKLHLICREADVSGIVIDQSEEAMA